MIFQTERRRRKWSGLPRVTVSTSEFCLRTLTVIVFRDKLTTPDWEAMAGSTERYIFYIFQVFKNLEQSVQVYYHCFKILKSLHYFKQVT